MKPGRVLSHVLLLLAALLTLLSVWVWSVNQDDLGQRAASTRQPGSTPQGRNPSENSKFDIKSASSPHPDCTGSYQFRSDYER